MNLLYTRFCAAGIFIRIIAIIFIIAVALLNVSKASVLSGTQHQTPQSLILKDAQMLDDNLFVLGKNNRLYCLNIQQNKASGNKNEKTNISGIFKDAANMYAWNDHDVFVYNNYKQEWKLINNFKDRYIKGIISAGDETKVIFFDGLMNLKDQSFIKSPFPIKMMIKGEDIYAVCANNFLYKLSKENKYIKIAKIDSVFYVKDMYGLNNTIFYLINNNLKILSTGIDKHNEINVADSITGILGFYNNKLFYKNSGGIFAFDLATKVNIDVLSDDIYNVRLLDNGNLLYNDAEGQCIYYQMNTKNTLNIGSQIKSYNIIDFIGGIDQDFIITTEGLVFKKGGNGQTFFDLSDASGKMYSAVQSGQEIFIACENGLLTFNVSTSGFYINKDLIGIECNSILLLDRCLYISSSERGMFKVKFGKIADHDPKVTVINEGLLTSSTYLLRNYNGILYTVSNSGVYKKDLKKDKWEEYAGSGFIEHITGIAHFKKHCNALLISSVEKGVMKTNDEGKTYSSMNLGLLDSAIISLEADSTGFYVLTKSGDIYFHPHEGIEWTKINEGAAKFNTVFLHPGLLFLVNNENNIHQLQTEQFTPGFYVNWDIKDTYCHGDKISLSFKFTGQVGKTNHAVLQLTLDNQSFNNGNVLLHSDLKEGNMEYMIPDSLPAGKYKIRVVGTDPFVHPEKATSGFTLRKGTPRTYPLVFKDEKGTMLNAVKVDQIKYEWIYNGNQIKDEGNSINLITPGSYALRYVNMTSGCSFTTKDNYFH